jgi:O-acetyl-ADP-ribose deacetylase (regulator of RNase III)
VAFPAISCGVYGYPLEAAAKIAVTEVAAFARDSNALDLVEFCCFSADVLAAYEQWLRSSGCGSVERSRSDRKD